MGLSSILIVYLFFILLGPRPAPGFEWGRRWLFESIRRCCFCFLIQRCRVPAFSVSEFKSFLSRMMEAACNRIYSVSFFLVFPSARRTSAFRVHPSQRLRDLLPFIFYLDLEVRFQRYLTCNKTSVPEFILQQSPDSAQTDCYGTVHFPYCETIVFVLSSAS